MNFLIVIKFLLVFLVSSQVLASMPCVAALGTHRTLGQSTEPSKALDFLKAEEHVSNETSKENIDQQLLSYMEFLTISAKRLINEHKKGSGSTTVNPRNGQKLLIKSFLTRASELANKSLRTHVLIIDRLLDAHLAKQEKKQEISGEIKLLQQKLDKEFIPAAEDLINYSKQVEYEFKKQDIETELGLDKVSGL